jgi:cytochrome c oxidase assembly protein subunit 15
MVYVQIVIGALVRHTGSGLAIPDFPLSYGRLIPPFFTRQIWVHFTHRIGALLIIFMVIWLATKVFSLRPAHARLRRTVIGLMITLAAQVLLGGATIWSSRGVVLTTLHVAGGALTLALSLYLALQAHRILQRRPDAGRRAPSWLTSNPSPGIKLDGTKRRESIPGVDA